MQPVGSAWRGLFNVAGGLPYHALARRWHTTLWRDYMLHVEKCLEDWRPGGAELVIIGPSAGWLLPAGLLQRFERVTAIEPDPLARWLLRRRFRTVAWNFDVHDYFTPHGPEPWRAGLQRLAQRYPSQPLFFAEFLGQFIGLYPDAVAREVDGQVVETPAFRAWKAEFRALCTTRPVFSSHDRLVARVAPKLDLVKLPAEVSAAELSAQLWPADAAVSDPLSGGLFPPGPRRVAVWPRRPGYWHAMELVATPQHGA